MPIPQVELDGWDRLDDETHVTYVRDDRLAKITVKTVTFADQGPGWIAKLWVKERPHGRSRHETDVADVDEAAFYRKLTQLASAHP